MQLMDELLGCLCCPRTRWGALGIAAHLVGEFLGCLYTQWASFSGACAAPAPSGRDFGVPVLPVHPSGRAFGVPTRMMGELCACAAPWTRWVSSWGAHVPCGQALGVSIHPVDGFLGCPCTWWVSSWGAMHLVGKLMGCPYTWWVSSWGAHTPSRWVLGVPMHLVGELLGYPCTPWVMCWGAPAACAPPG